MAAAPKEPTFPIPRRPEYKEKYDYHHGFGNHFESESIKGALPVGQNTPQKCPLGLYAEQLSGTAFTVPRHNNQRTWCYRILPSVCHTKYTKVEHDGSFTNRFAEFEGDPSQFRWSPRPIPGDDKPTDFVQGMHTFAGAGDPSIKSGIAIHMYVANVSMVDKSFYNSDGDFLIVPQEGPLDITTELGKMFVNPGEICVIQRGIQFSVGVEGPSRGYICEVYTSHFKIPDLGPIGANGLANPRDFKTPKAWFEDRECSFEVVGKFLGDLWTHKRDHSVFNVVAWHGNYAPFKYNLDDFCVVNSVSYDHLDPSIFTVLTAPTNEPGVAAVDFAIFPPRFMVQEGTFRPPYFHKNVMSEYMGLVRGMYEAKNKPGGFVPGGGSLHSALAAHGPDLETFERASNADLKPAKLPDTMAFMFESSYLFKVTDWAHKSGLAQEDYHESWSGLKKHFKMPEKHD